MKTTFRCGKEIILGKYITMLKRMMIMQTLMFSIGQFVICTTALGGLINITGAQQQVGAEIGCKYKGGNVTVEKQLVPVPPQGPSDANLSISFAHYGVSVKESLNSVFLEDQVTASGSAYASAVWGQQPADACDVHGGGGSGFALSFTRGPSPAYLNVNGQINIDMYQYPYLHPEETFVYVKLSSDDGTGMITLWKDAASGTGGDTSKAIGHSLWLEADRIYLLEAYAESGTVASKDHTGFKSRTASFSLASRISCCCELNAQRHEIVFPSCGPFTCWPGRITEPIEAESGERIEVWWVWEMRLPPVPHYELIYYRPGAGEGLSEGFRIGACNFPEGGNFAHYFAPDNNHNGQPDCFCKFIWNSWDFGQDDGYKGYLDHYLHTYDVCNDKYSLIKFLYHYPNGCEPPVSEPPDVGNLKEECYPPYEVYNRIVKADPPLGPETEALFDELLLELQDFPPDEIVMGHFPVDLCDMDWDGDCDPVDFHIINNAVGKCWEETAYYPLADIDGDGCVSGSDLELIFPSNQPPVADAGPDQTVEQDSHAGASITLDGSGSYDPDDDPLTYSWTWDVGSTTGVNPTVVLPLGTTTITLVVNDGKVDSDPDTVDITIEDTTPPAINSISASPDVLWPPNHRMVEVTVTVDCTDICDPVPFCYILGVTSNEPINSPGDGNIEPDWEFTDDPLVVLLRAERAGTGVGRIYTIYVECMDASGNVACRIVEVTVPHDQGKGKK